MLTCPSCKSAICCVRLTCLLKSSSKALRIARSSESAIVLSSHGTKDHVVSVHRFNNPSNEDKNYNGNFKCYRCGGVSHKPAECRAKNMKCNNCQKVGHFARVCRSSAVSRKMYESQMSSGKKKGKTRKKIRAIRRKDAEESQSCGESCSESESGEEYVLFGRARQSYSSHS